MNALLAFLFVLTIIAMGAIWHMDVHHNLDKLGEKRARGIFPMSPESAYRMSQYILVASILAYDLLLAYLIFN